LSGKIFVIGDIHGCYREFRALLKKLDYTKDKDTLYLTGDLIDRGPQPLQTVLYAKEMGALCVQGNHERKHLAYREAQLKGKPEERQHSYDWLKTHNQLTEEAWIYLASFPLYRHITEEWLLIHGDIDPRLLLGKMSRGELENRKHWVQEWEGPEKIVFGHMISDLGSVFSVPERGLYGTDSGCCFGGKLSAVIINVDGTGVKVVQVDAKEEYARLRKRRPFPPVQLLRPD
jgi:bis(5'-nucleosyl)-tetraphosphatase (symmetrical)